MTVHRLSLDSIYVYPPSDAWYAMVLIFSAFHIKSTCTVMFCEPAGIHWSPLCYNVIKHTVILWPCY